MTHPYYDSPSHHRCLQLFFDEPDTFHGEAHGLPLAALRGPCKHWCGYVGVPPAHPLFGQDYYTRVIVPDADSFTLDKQSPISILLEAGREDDSSLQLSTYINVHGGLTYAKANLPYDDDTADSFWWFGFDCNHYQDLSPQAAIQALIDPDARFQLAHEYRTLAYVQQELTSLAQQLSTFSLPLA